MLHKALDDEARAKKIRQMCHEFGGWCIIPAGPFTTHISTHHLALQEFNS